MQILPCGFNRSVPHDSLYNVEWNPFLHKSSGQRVTQSVRINFLNTAAFGDSRKSNLKAFRIKMRSYRRGKQQIVRIARIRVCHRIEMPDQKLSQLIGDGNCPNRFFRLRLVLNDQVRFLCRIIIKDTDVRIIEGERRSFYPDQIFRNLTSAAIARRHNAKSPAGSRRALRFPCTPAHEKS